MFTIAEWIVLLWFGLIIVPPIIHITINLKGKRQL